MESPSQTQKRCYGITYPDTKKALQNLHSSFIGGRYGISSSGYCYKFDHKTKTTKRVSLKLFVEEDDIHVDFLTKFQPNPVWNLRETIKTHVRCEICCKFSILHS
jgi:hypothetical protein